VTGKTIAKVAVSAANYVIDRPFDYAVPEQLQGKVQPGVRVIVPFSRGNRRTEGIVLSIGGESSYKEIKYIDSVLDEAPVLTDEQIRLALWIRERCFCTVYDAVKAMLPVGLWYSLSCTYRITEGTDRESAFLAAGRSKNEIAVLELLFASNGSCELRDIERAFGEETPARALSSLVKKGIISTDNKAKQRAKDKTVDFIQLAIPADEAFELSQRKKRAPSQAAVLSLLAAAGRTSVREVRYFTGVSQQTIKSLAVAGYIEVIKQEAFRRPNYRSAPRCALPELNSDQEKAFKGLLELAGKDRRCCAAVWSHRKRKDVCLRALN